MQAASATWDQIGPYQTVLCGDAMNLVRESFPVVIEEVDHGGFVLVGGRAEGDGVRKRFEVTASLERTTGGRADLAEFLAQVGRPAMFSWRSR